MSKYISHFTCTHTCRFRTKEETQTQYVYFPWKMMYTCIVYLFCKSYNVSMQCIMCYRWSWESRANDLYPWRYTGRSTLRINTPCLCIVCSIFVYSANKEHIQVLCKSNVVGTFRFNSSNTETFNCIKSLYLKTTITQFVQANSLSLL